MMLGARCSRVFDTGDVSDQRAVTGRRFEFSENSSWTVLEFNGGRCAWLMGIRDDIKLCDLEPVGGFDGATAGLPPWEQRASVRHRRIDRLG
jgi:hypothetical protein